MFQEITYSSLELKFNNCDCDMASFNVSVQLLDGFEPFTTFLTSVPHGAEIFVKVCLKRVINLQMTILANVRFVSLAAGPILVSFQKVKPFTLLLTRIYAWEEGHMPRVELVLVTTD